jgi:hypothetical protein
VARAAARRSAAGDAYERTAGPGPCPRPGKRVQRASGGGQRQLHDETRTTVGRRLDNDLSAMQINQPFGKVQPQSGVMTIPLAGEGALKDAVTIRPRKAFAVIAHRQRET